MKKHFMMIAAVVFGILIAFASCKDSKKHRYDYDDDDDEDIELTDGDDNEGDDAKAQALRKISSMDDLRTLRNIDLNNADLSELDLEDIDLDNIDLDEIDQNTADKLLQLVSIVANKEMPIRAGDGMTMTEFTLTGSNAEFVVEMDASALSGLSMSDFQAALNMDQVKKEMVKSMMSDADEDMKTFIKVIVAANKNFALRFKDKNTGESAVIRVTCDELKQLQ